jgi:hypothetical protein
MIKGICDTIRTQLLTVGACVLISVRRIVFSLASHHPHRAAGPIAILSSLNAQGHSKLPIEPVRSARRLLRVSFFSHAYSG